MGKVRIKTIGVEEEEDKQKKQAAKRAEKKREEAKAAAETNETETPKKEPTESDEIKEEKTEKKKKPSKYKTKKSQKHSTNYLAIAKLIDKNKKHTVDEALKILLTTKMKFDETVELHINTNEKGVSGKVTLPHGTGKETRVEIADVAADPKHVEELIKKIAGGQIDFDVLIATPDTMPALASAARFLGPRGLMPNPKNGTISPKPKDALKQFEGGQINFKTEPKFPIIHMSIGKVSFGEKKLSENIKELIQAIKSKNIKSATIKSTMSPGIRLSTTS